MQNETFTFTTTVETAQGEMPALVWYGVTAEQIELAKAEDKQNYPAGTCITYSVTR